MRISDWSSDVCSSDLETAAEIYCCEAAGICIAPPGRRSVSRAALRREIFVILALFALVRVGIVGDRALGGDVGPLGGEGRVQLKPLLKPVFSVRKDRLGRAFRSEEHTSELQSLMRISYAVFFLNNKT